MCRGKATLLTCVVQFTDQLDNHVESVVQCCVEGDSETEKCQLFQTDIGSNGLLIFLIVFEFIWMALNSDICRATFFLQSVRRHTFRQHFHFKICYSA